MKFEHNKKGFNLTGLTLDEINAILIVVFTANDRCFGEDDKQKNGDYYSNDDFVCTLSTKQRRALDKFCKSYLKQLHKEMAKLSE